MVPKTTVDGRKGLVFNIQRFSVHDGPGMRTTVFMKGCPLSCLWCSNPESQDLGPQLMTRNAKCNGCGACESVCPKGAISMNAGIREIDWDKCQQCLKCVDSCMYDALHRCGEEMTVAEVLDEVMRDKLFYKNSGGGITVSGGEPLLQSEFVAALLKACKNEGLHTTIDTTGYTAWHKIRAVIRWVDLILWDIKHLDRQEHERATGVGNRLILENLKRASEFVRIWLRVPLIGGFNDGEDYIGRVIALAREVGAEKISLLPYHEGGKSKNEQIGRTYPFFDGHAPTDEEVARLQQRIVQNGIDVGIGN